MKQRQVSALWSSLVKQRQVAASWDSLVEKVNLLMKTLDPKPQCKGSTYSL